MSTTEREVVRELPAVLDPRVERGAALLDEKMPGWAEKIDVDILDLVEQNYCVLGQIGLCVNYGDYYDTASQLLGVDCSIGGTRAEKAHGFWAATGDPDDEEEADWDPVDAGLLEADWRLAILSRRTA